MKSFLKNTAFEALIAALGVWFAASVLLNDFLISGIAAVFAAVIVWFWLSVRKKLLRKKKARIVEKDLPFALLSLSSEISYNPSFENSLQNTAVQNFGLFSQGLRTALREVRDSGASVQEALLHFAECFESTQLKRSISQIIAAFEQGSRKESASNLKKLALELLARQRIESKQYSSRLAVFSIMFISMSAVVPALFQAFIIVGSAFLELNFTAFEVLLIGTVVFPLANIGILFFVLESAPECLKNRRA